MDLQSLCDIVSPISKDLIGSPSPSKRFLKRRLIYTQPSSYDEKEELRLLESDTECDIDILNESISALSDLRIDDNHHDVTEGFQISEMEAGNVETSLNESISSLSELKISDEKDILYSLYSWCCDV